MVTEAGRRGGGGMRSLPASIFLAWFLCYGVNVPSQRGPNMRPRVRVERSGWNCTVQKIVTPVYRTSALGRFVFTHHVLPAPFRSANGTRTSGFGASEGV